MSGKSRARSGVKKSSPSLRDARLRFATHYETVLRRANRLYLQGGEAQARALQILQVEWDNIETAWASVEKLANNDRRVVELRLAYPEAGS